MARREAASAAWLANARGDARLLAGERWAALELFAVRFRQRQATASCQVAPTPTPRLGRPTVALATELTRIPLVRSAVGARVVTALVTFLRQERMLRLRALAVAAGVPASLFVSIFG